jgi:hypothetical protein
MPGSNKKRIALAAVALAGLAASVWEARPVDVTHIPGWRTAILWTSVAWLLVLAVIVPWMPVSGIVAALVMAGVVELIVLWLADPLASAAKPLYQVPAILACAFLAFGRKPERR